MKKKKEKVHMAKYIVSQGAYEQWADRGYGFWKPAPWGYSKLLLAEV